MVELHIFLSDSQIPDRAAWQRTIEQLGFPTGFEFSLEPAADILSSYSHIVPQIGQRDRCATFRWGGDLIEMCAALSSAAALVKISDGIYFYPDDDILYTADEAVEATRRDLSSV
jgi:hypothetical protein